MLENIYNQTVTVLNKLKATDSLTKRDVWYKTVLDDVAWYTDSTRTATSSAVYIGTYIKVLIPFHNEYLTYLEWRKPSNQDEHYTMSTGDYIVLGEVPDDITADNIVKTLQKYGENVCQVKHHKESYNRFGARVQLMIEGV